MDHLCIVVFTSQVRTHTTKCVSNSSRPKLANAILGAGLSFSVSKGHAELNLPMDLFTPSVSDIELFNQAACFWAYKYNVCTPHIMIFVLHDYHGSQFKPKQRDVFLRVTTWIQYFRWHERRRHIPILAGPCRQMSPICLRDT